MKKTIDFFIKTLLFFFSIAYGISQDSDLTTGLIVGFLLYIMLLIIVLTFANKMSYAVDNLMFKFIPKPFILFYSSLFKAPKLRMKIKNSEIRNRLWRNINNGINHLKKSNLHFATYEQGMPDKFIKSKKFNKVIPKKIKEELTQILKIIVELEPEEIFYVFFINNTQNYIYIMFNWMEYQLTDSGSKDMLKSKYLLIEKEFKSFRNKKMDDDIERLTNIKPIGGFGVCPSCRRKVKHFTTRCPYCTSKI